MGELISMICNAGYFKLTWYRSGLHARCLLS
jgi:hypothetical protein